MKASLEACRRLVDELERIKSDRPYYHAHPVALFGDPQAWLSIIGLAPGLHRADASARPFSGDHAGILVSRTLHRCGCRDRPESSAAGDGLKLLECCITHALKCLPLEMYQSVFVPARARLQN